jgi:hypothetical protein
MTEADQLESVARAIIDDNHFMTLGTADDNGLPWVSPVWYAQSAYREFLWVSDPGARHSRNLAVRPELSIVIFNSRATPESAQAVYISATAEALTGAGLEQGIGSFSAYSQAQGAAGWRVVDDRGGVDAASEEADRPPRSTPLRLYRAVASEHFVLDPDAAVDRRAAVSI